MGPVEVVKIRNGITLTGISAGGADKEKMIGVLFKGAKWRKVFGVPKPHAVPVHQVVGGFDAFIVEEEAT